MTISTMAGLLEMPHYVYRLYDAAGVLLYVGCTYDPRTRRSNLRLTAPWFKDVATFRLTIYPNRGHALQVERAVIAAEHPRYNVIGRTRQGAA
jgi:excinuclease UvrABC nuclease subunit